MTVEGIGAERKGVEGKGSRSRSVLGPRESCTSADLHVQKSIVYLCAIPKMINQPKFDASSYFDKYCIYRNGQQGKVSFCDMNGV